MISLTDFPSAPKLVSRVLRRETWHALVSVVEVDQFSYPAPYRKALACGLVGGWYTRAQVIGVPCVGCISSATLQKRLLVIGLADISSAG